MFPVPFRAGSCSWLMAVSRFDLGLQKMLSHYFRALFGTFSFSTGFPRLVPGTIGPHSGLIFVRFASENLDFRKRT
jgi:hypothetical protein